MIETTANSGFATTHWSALRAVGGTTSPRSKAAFETLAQTYWYPLYAFARRMGHSPADAADLTQGLFERLIESDSLSTVSRERGRFRTFLLTAFQRFMADERKAARRAKRGGGATVISIDANSGEERYRVEPADQYDAEQLYQRRWAMTILDQALARLESELRGAGRSRIYSALQGFLIGDRDGPAYAEVARRLGTSEAAVKMTVSRLRQRARELIRDQIAQTVSTPAEVDQEYAALIAALRS